MSYPSPLNAVARKLNDQVAILSCPFLRVKLLQIGARSSFITLPSQALVVHAPLPYDAQSEEIVAGRPVKYLIAPDFEHHMALKSWKDKFPDAVVIGVTGLKARKAPQGVVVDYEVAEANKVLSAADFGIQDPDLAEFQFVYLPAFPNKELVTFHKPTRTIFQADLLMTFPLTEQYSKVPSSENGRLTPLFKKALATKRFQRMLVSDAASATAGLKAVQSLDFDTIVPCHGEVAAGDGRTVFEKYFEQFLA
ncbi:uncharacterized protein V1510DRAFT_421949 [Dipodascopsis tothii]|uniref:uncharacterized protein n=1 Tax=Dipodascopsis tothii TaxID=44089 RepID=UPI0034D016A6